MHDNSSNTTKKIPTFHRQNYTKLKIKGKDKWKRPKGLQSKLRKGKRGKGSMPVIGFRKSKKNRYKIRNYNIIEVSNESDLKRVNPKVDGVLIRHVGLKKYLLLVEKCKKAKIKILNKMRKLKKRG
ncbi:MAG: hypothetical protein DRP08_00755 [Candidatus Aenigmatarchaeota archaeon]|nr:MAG: hypothetical protein DRP08_00755 [Candidatus Aenigmarchaeota archaeon]